jgi:hypothetical protein
MRAVEVGGGGEVGVARSLPHEEKRSMTSGVMRARQTRLRLEVVLSTFDSG